MRSGRPKLQIVESKHSIASVLTVALGVLGVLGELLVGVRLRSEARDRNGDDIADRTPDRGDEIICQLFPGCGPLWSVAALRILRERVGPIWGQSSALPSNQNDRRKPIYRAFKRFKLLNRA